MRVGSANLSLFSLMLSLGAVNDDATNADRPAMCTVMCAVMRECPVAYAQSRVRSKCDALQPEAKLAHQHTSSQKRQPS